MVDDPHPVNPHKVSKKNLYKLFFGLELLDCRGGQRCLLGAAGAKGIIAGSFNKIEESEFL